MTRPERVAATLRPRRVALIEKLGHRRDNLRWRKTLGTSTLFGTPIAVQSSVASPMV